MWFSVISDYPLFWGFLKIFPVILKPIAYLEIVESYFSVMKFLLSLTFLTYFSFITLTCSRNILLWNHISDSTFELCIDLFTAHTKQDWHSMVFQNLFLANVHWLRWLHNLVILINLLVSKYKLHSFLSVYMEIHVCHWECFSYSYTVRFKFIQNSINCIL